MTKRKVSPAPKPEASAQRISFQISIIGDILRDGSGLFLVVNRSPSERWALLQAQAKPNQQIRLSEFDFDRRAFTLERAAGGKET